MNGIRLFKGSLMLVCIFNHKIQILFSLHKIKSKLEDGAVVVVVEIYGIYCVFPVRNGAEKVIRRKNMLNWVVAQKRIDAVDSTINHAHFGLWDSKQNMDYSIGASTH